MSFWHLMCYIVSTFIMVAVAYFLLHRTTSRAADPVMVSSRAHRYHIEGRSGRTSRSVDKKANAVVCNGITASSFLTSDAAGHVRRACRCHWPTLFGQESLFSDCNVQHACDGGKGVLVHKITRRPLIDAEPPIDIHDYECSRCDRCNVPGPDPHTGLPSCLPRPFNDRDGDMCLYDVDSPTDVYSDDATNTGDDNEHATTKPMLELKSRFVDKAFVASFTDRAREAAWVPNPCAYDLFTGARMRNGCELRLTRKSNIAYCAPLRDDAMTAVKEDTYLMNNSGMYPNACFRFTSDERHVNGYVIEYFVRKRSGRDLPSPVVSMRIARKDVLGSVVAGLGLTRVPPQKMLLFTQPEPPSDVKEFPHPFHKRRMADFTKEFNYWLGVLPAKCSIRVFLYNCSAPVQALPITACSRIGESDRDPSDKSITPHGGVIGDQTVAYAKSTVACKNPEYEPRFPIVPNYNISPGSTDSTLTSAILFFDKSNNTVYPHWKEVGEDVSTEFETIQRYVRSQLQSAPNETLK